MRIAADIIKGRHVAKGVRVIVIPGTQEVYLQMLEEGLTKAFIEAGAIVSNSNLWTMLGRTIWVLWQLARELYPQPTVTSLDVWDT